MAMICTPLNYLKTLMMAGESDTSNVTHQIESKTNGPGHKDIMLQRY